MDVLNRRSRLSLFFLLFSALFSSSSFSSDFVWGNNPNWYSSPEQACLQLAIRQGYTLSYYQTKAGAITFQGPASSTNPSYSCYFTITLTNDDGSQRTYPNQGPLSFIRNGDSCSGGGKFDTTTGLCAAANKCAILANTPVPSYKWQSSTDTPSATISVNGCEATVSGVSLCKNTSSGIYSCSGTATLTGNELAASTTATASSCDSAACTASDPVAETKNQDCVYSSSADGKSTCSASSSTSNPGTTSCGTVNGAWTCIENPKSTSVASTLNSTKTQTSNTDGTVTVVKDDSLSTTTCNGVRNCSSSSSSSTGTTVLNSSGATVSSSSTCTGGKCTSSGTTLSPSDSVSDEQDDGTSPTTTSLKAPTKGSFDGQEADWDSKIEKSKADLIAGLSKFKNVFSDVGGLSLSAGAKLYCPPPVEVLNTSLSFCVDEYASSLSWISYAVLLLCAGIALFIVFG